MWGFFGTNELTLALELAAPIYNLALVFVVIYLFAKMFSLKNKMNFYLLPWKLIFVSLMIFVAEEVITIMRGLGWISITKHINGFFELCMVIIYIYALLLQREHLHPSNVKDRPKLAKKKRR